jgi:hypothetical protein
MSQKYTGTFINDLVETAEKAVRAVEFDRSLQKGTKLPRRLTRANSSVNNYVIVEPIAAE